MIIEIEKYIALFFIYSFAGWLMETIRISIKEKKFVDRGFLIGPYCPIYGTGVLLITILLRKYSDDVWATFFMSILICGILEYLTSYFMEKIFKARWWDYSTRKFNINGRICLETLIPFGIMGTFITFVANPFFLKYINMIPIVVMHVIIGVLSVIFLVDTIISYKIIFDLKEMSREFKDNTIEISDKVKKIIRNKSLRLHRRLVKAFPGIREYVRYNTWDEIKKKIEESTEQIRERINTSKAELKRKLDESKQKFN